MQPRRGWTRYRQDGLCFAAGSSRICVRRAGQDPWLDSLVEVGAVSFRFPYSPHVRLEDDVDRWLRDGLTRVAGEWTCRIEQPARGLRRSRRRIAVRLTSPDRFLSVTLAPRRLGRPQLLDDRHRVVARIGRRRIDVLDAAPELTAALAVASRTTRLTERTKNPLWEEIGNLPSV